DFHVTGVQTCALPISCGVFALWRVAWRGGRLQDACMLPVESPAIPAAPVPDDAALPQYMREFEKAAAYLGPGQIALLRRAWAVEVGTASCRERADSAW